MISICWVYNELILVPPIVIWMLTTNQPFHLRSFCDLKKDWLLLIDWMWIQLSRLCSIDMIAYYEGSVGTILIVISSWIHLLLSSLDWCILEDKMLLSTLVALEYCFRWHSLVDLCIQLHLYYFVETDAPCNCQYFLYLLRLVG